MTRSKSFTSVLKWLSLQYIFLIYKRHLFYFSETSKLELLKEHKNSLLKELDVERKRTAEEEKIHDSITSKYESTWENYKEIYNGLPITVERSKLHTAFKIKDIQLMKLQMVMDDIKQKYLLTKQIQERTKQLNIVKMAEAYVGWKTSLEIKAVLVRKIRTLRNVIEEATVQKKRNLDLSIMCQTAKHLAADASPVPLSAHALSCRVRMPSFQPPSSYSPPKKILCLEQTNSNVSRYSFTDRSAVTSHHIIQIMKRDIEKIFKLKKQACGGQDFGMVSSPAVSQVPTQAFSAIKPTEKNVQQTTGQATNSAATPIFYSVADTSQSLLSRLDTQRQIERDIQSQSNTGQSQIITDKCTNQKESPTSALNEPFPCTLLNDTTEKTPTSSSVGADMSTLIAHVSTATGIDTSGAGETTETSVQKEDAEHHFGHHGDHHETPANESTRKQSLEAKQRSRPGFQFLHTLLNFGTSKQCDSVTEKTPNNHVDIQPEATNNEVSNDDRISEDAPHLSSSIEEDMMEIEEMTVQEKNKNNYLNCSSPEGRSSTSVSSRQDFIASPPFAISPEASSDFFGASNSHGNDSGFNFNFGGPLSTANVGDNNDAKKKTTEAVKFVFDQKSSSGFFKMF
ncbi:uncharacterized protein [Periplaneta americana]|uniref:uncharacterized protein n=1 Tax=Periplaneta americana TaxID=6978 RepID=UPI0037E79B82